MKIPYKDALSVSHTINHLELTPSNVYEVSQIRDL